MKIIKNKGITAVKGIYTLGKSAGIKESKKKDFAILYSEKQCNTSAVYTKNHVKGAPLYITKEHLKNGNAQAIVAISGCSNVCTGKKGIEDAKEITKLVAAELGLKKEDILIAQTGIIGELTPMQKIKKAVKGIKKELNKRSKDAAESILTTDLSTKEVAVKIDNITIGAMAKGSGMIHPDMATMLCFIFTDADFPPHQLKEMLKKAVDNSFNMVSVDMDTSTSDMVTIMANGLAGKVSENKFQAALDHICKELAKKIAVDGEGATKLVEVDVKNAQTEKDAKSLAKSVITSNLVKTAIFGNDPNWGRIMAAIGCSGVKFTENKVDIFFNNKQIAKNGVAVKFNPEEISKLMKTDKLIITINLNHGKSNGMAWGCDLTYDYVKLNADYHT